MRKVESMFAELYSFSSNIAIFNGPADQTLIEAFETTNRLILPDDYKVTIKQMNGFSIMSDEVYGVLGKAAPQSLENIYDYEHFEVQYPQHNYLVPFSPDGGGNFYCFDTRFSTKNGDSCPIVFWVSNYQYNDSDVPEVVYDSFLDFVNEVIIGWTLKAFDYEGNER
jgi:SMI1-KNR4 cell-wall